MFHWSDFKLRTTWGETLLRKYIKLNYHSSITVSKIFKGRNIFKICQTLGGKNLTHSDAVLFSLMRKLGF